MARRPGPGDPVLGTSWQRHGSRRSQSARIARLLRPIAHLMGGLASTELTVSVRRAWHRPDVGVVLGAEVPPDGVLARAPALVVRLGGPLPVAAWLAAGAREVWSWEDGAVVVARRDGRVEVAEGGWLAHRDEPALRLASAELRPPVARGARTGA